MRGDAIVIRLNAPPVDGAANEALVAFLSDVLGVPRRDISLVAGEKSRDKRVRVAGVNQQSAAERLTAAAASGGKKPRAKSRAR